MLCSADSTAAGQFYPDVTIRNYGAAGNPDKRIQPIEASGLKFGFWLIDPKTQTPCTVASEPKKSKTGKHGSAKISCKLKLEYSSQATDDIMKAGHEQLNQCIVENNEYSFSFMTGDPADKTCNLLKISCLDANNNDCELKLSRERQAVWDKVTSAVAKGMESGEEIILTVQEAPSVNKAARHGYDILQLIIDGKVVKDDFATDL